MILQTPFTTPDCKGVYGIEIKPQDSPVPPRKRGNWWQRWRCHHEYKTYHREYLMFYQEAMVTALYKCCSKCGTLLVEEID